MSTQPDTSTSQVTTISENEEISSIQPNVPADISADDEISYVIALDTEDLLPSCSNTATNTTPNKQIPSITKELPINGTVKSVPPAVPIVNNDKNCIDLTDDDIEVFNGEHNRNAYTTKLKSIVQEPCITNIISASTGSLQHHPAPLPGTPIARSVASSQKPPPAPKISLTPSIEGKALLLSWNMNITKMHADILSYQIYAYKEISSDIPTTEIWKEIGNIKALTLPMACSLRKFAAGDKYHFSVRAMDVYYRIGPFSSPNSVVFH